MDTLPQRYSLQRSSFLPSSVSAKFSSLSFLSSVFYLLLRLFFLLSSSSSLYLLSSSSSFLSYIFFFLFCLFYILSFNFRTFLSLVSSIFSIGRNCWKFFYFTTICGVIFPLSHIFVLLPSGVHMVKSRFN